MLSTSEFARMRGEFEAHESRGDPLRLGCLTCQRDGANGYLEHSIQDRWLLWQKAWNASQTLPVAKGLATDYLEGVHIPRLREALTFLGCNNGVGEGEVGAKLPEYVNAITRAVLRCKELLRSASQRQGDAQ